MAYCSIRTHISSIWQWLVGMPIRLRAFCQFGKHRDIEVEDEVTASRRVRQRCDGRIYHDRG